MRLTYAKIANKPRILRSQTGLSPEAFRQLAPSFAQAYEAHLDEQDRQRQPHRQLRGGGRKSAIPAIEDKLLFILFYFKVYPLQGGAGALFRDEPTPGPFLEPSSDPPPESGVWLRDVTAGSEAGGPGAGVGSLSGSGVHQCRYYCNLCSTNCIQQHSSISP